MKRIIGIIATLGAAFVMPLAALAYPAIPANPVSFWGTATVNGVAAKTGAIVTVYEPAGTKIAEAKIVSAGNYAINVSVSSGISVGETVSFKIDGTAAGSAAMVDYRTKPSVNLNLATAVSNPPSSGGSSGGGGGGINNNNTDDDEDEDDDREEIPSEGIFDPEELGNLGGDEDGSVKGETSVNVLDGDIIQCKGSHDPFAVYIVKIANGKRYIRHIVSLEIFNFYSHLKWENLIQVDDLKEYTLSGWVRVNTGANGTAGPDDKVWEINGDQTRHHIDMTAEEFLLHGGSEDAIYNINQGELNLYKVGPAVKLM